MSYVSASTSTGIGVAPTSDTQRATLEKVFAGMITSSPGPMPETTQARCIAAVPFARLATWGLRPSGAPRNAPNSSSSAFPSDGSPGVVRMWRPDSITRPQRLSSGSHKRFERYDALRH